MLCNSDLLLIEMITIVTFLQDKHFRNRNGYPLITVFILTTDIQTTIKLNIGLNKTNKIQK